MAPEFLTAGEAIDLFATLGLRMTRGRLYVLVREGVLSESGGEVLRLGRLLRFRRSALQRFIETGGAGIPARDSVAA